MKGSQAEKDELRLEELFPYTDYNNFDPLRLIYEGPWLNIIVKSKRGNLLTRQMLEQVTSLSQKIMNISANWYGSTITVRSVCLFCVIIACN